MSIVKKKAIELIENIPNEVVKDKFTDLVHASESSIDFWLNEEDEVWNDV